MKRKIVRKSQKTVSLVIVFLTAFVLGLQAQDSFLQAERQFSSISDRQPLAVYWYWMAGNMSVDGVRKDLEAMKKAGINRVQIGMIGEGNGTPTGPVRMFSDEWWEILHAMFKRAGELDIEVGLFNCPGWSQSGGPWVKETQAMRYLDMATDTVVGPARYQKKLPGIEGNAQDVCVLAFPITGGNQQYTSEADVAGSASVVLTAPLAGTARSLVLYPVEARTTRAELLVAEADGSYRHVESIDIDRSNAQKIVGFSPMAPIVVSIPETFGKTFRLDIADTGVIGKAVLSDKPAVERWPEKTFAKMWQTPHPMWDAYLWRPQPAYAGTNVLQAGQVKDLSRHVNSDGMLDWNVPEGQWVVMRTAMLPTGTTCSPAPVEGTGLETDKMSKKHIRAHFDNYIGEILKRIPAEDRKTFRIVVEDSYETGGQNWTDELVNDFKTAYGYDPLPYIPAIFGEVVGSEDESDRFLWDLRRLVADEVAYNYVGGLREVSNEHGLTTWLENYGHWGFPGEFLLYGSQSDEVAGEFWSYGDLGDIENRCASSCGHIYGKRRVWAESFTCGASDFSHYPAMMKARGDRFFTEGINATLLHVYIQQPDERVPGFCAWFGNEFNRHNTWFSQMDVFAQYLKRCNYMLQQGRYVADVAYFIGEDAPKMTGVRNPELPQGYSYDYLNRDVLMTAHVEDGELVLESGMRYRILVLPKQETMRPELLEKLSELVKEGLAIEGPAPQRSPSLQDYPACDGKVSRLARAMWQPEQQQKGEPTAYGKGRIYQHSTLEDIFKQMGIGPDFSAGTASLPVLFIHKRLSDGDYYFLSNQSDRQIAFDGTFRIGGRRPELWDSLTGEQRWLPQYVGHGETTTVPIKLLPGESAFVVFRAESGRFADEKANYPEPQLVATIDTPWTVDFQKEHGGPEEVLHTDSLFDWTQSSDHRIRYFSGTATYTTSVKVGRMPKNRQVYIDLGKVMVMAKVKVNGCYVGGAWTSPYRVNVTGVLHKGNNKIEVEVVNCWRNRLIGEKGEVPDNERYTFHTTSFLNKDSDLQPSGLIGPVVIEAYDYLPISASH
ncbi:MAG: glycoside hydrolase family 2 [Prevotella sp.]|nr:glycoside hydrolase family 2 [Prevotella sp.]